MQKGLNIPRSLSLFLVLTVISIIIFTIFILVLPPFIKEFNEILVDIPNGLSKINILINTNLNKFNILYKGENNFVAHECILDFRELKSKTGLSVNDLAKRLIDYSFHAPTISWPVPETIMIEPTESESLVELDRICEAMLMIGEEISEIENNHEINNNNVISKAPHTLKELIADNWHYPNSKEKASFPYKTPTSNKFWSSVSRINNAYGDRNLICSCNVNQGETFEEKKCA